MNVQCDNKECKHQWNYKGKNPFYVMCPRCRKISKLTPELQIKVQNENN